jgi:uncharacterized protein YecE (DUF72 family)
MAGKLKVGLAGWSYKDWEGIVYPESLKGGARLAYVAKYFDLVEINTSFYGPIKPETARTWCQLVTEENPDFVFTAKLYRGFTHSPAAMTESTSAETIRPAANDEGDTKRGFDALASQGRLGAVLAQFPISFKNDDKTRAYLEKLLLQFSEYPMVLEIRHASWNKPEVLEWLASMRVGLCNIDQPLLGKAIRPSAHATSTVGYVRLHGRNYKNWFAESNVRDRYDYLYSERELDHWKERTEEIAEQASTTYVVTNNHNLGKAAVNALELIHLLEGSKVKVPPPLLEHYPKELIPIAAPMPEAKTVSAAPDKAATELTEFKLLSPKTYESRKRVRRRR